MKTSEMISTAPIAVEKSTRGEELRSITSCKAGLIVPLSFIPLLREDRVTRGAVRVGFDMKETLHPLLNSVHVTVMAHYVSPMAFDRFYGLDSLNRSYQGIAEPQGTGGVIPYFPTIVYNKADAFWHVLGVQWPDGTPINSAPVEAYNAIVNFRRRSRSDRLPMRTALDTTLAEAFWKQTQLGHIVPDYDQAAMDGEVELSWVQSRLGVRGLGKKEPGTLTAASQLNVNVMEKQDPSLPVTAATYPYAQPISTDASGNIVVRWSGPNAGSGAPEVWAELADAGVTVSLANIELAKKTAAFAKLRDQYDGLDDDHIIDLLMEGIRVPDEALKQPLLLDRKSSIFGYNERHAMDGESLEVGLSRTTGKTELTVNFRTPPMNTGGVIMITAEIVPEQLYERMQDCFLATSDPATLPNFMRDYLDPEKVEIVQNNYADVMHSTPSATFGYAPLNHKWRRSLTRAGGKFRRPFPDTFVEDRQRFWSADQVNPTLSDDFYMVSDLPHTVFADTISDPFEVLTLGHVQIVGNTVFGDRLEEDAGSYEEIMEQVDTGRINMVPVPAAAEASPKGATDKGKAK